MKRKAFTRAELIVTLSILAFLGALAAILVPVFKRAVKNSKHSSCQSNLKQIGLAMKQYTQDYNEKFPRYDIGNVGVTEQNGLTATHWVQSLQPYTKSVLQFQCPQDEEYTLGTDYYLSKIASGARETSFKNSANSVLMCEGTDTSLCDQATATAPITFGTPPAYARQLEGSNYAFVDGHVRWFNSSRAPNAPSTAEGGFTLNS